MHFRFKAVSQLRIRPKRLVVVRILSPCGGGKLKRCPKCGADNPNSAWRCQSCGASLFWTLPGLGISSKTRRNPVRWLVLPLILAVIAISFFLMAPLYSSTIVVHVDSTHLVQTVHYRLYIDGDQRAEGDLAPGQTITWTLQYRFSPISSKSIVVSAMATGGALGDTQDERQLTIADDSTYEITLRV